MKKLFPRLLALLLVITMLPISALATLENHNVADVIIAQSTNENNYYFPDIIMHPDGTLLVCYYQNLMHVGEATGTIYMAESTDNGYTWSDPWEVVAYPGCDSRDPNLAILPNGTVCLTWFYGSGEKDGTWMKLSTDKGRTWGEEIQLESDILDEGGLAKRGNIAPINDENMLIPVYGISSGDNAYGAPATPIGERGQFSTYHRDAAILHYQKNEDGLWVKVNESLLGQEIDETGVMYTGEGIMGEDGISFDGEVYCLSREDGSVRVSRDSANTWELIAKEEPRMYRYEAGAIIMSAEQIIQPRMWKISDDAWFVTYANYNNLNYAYDRLSRPVYGKVFFPEEGWYGTQAKLIHDAADVQDMADPATVLTAEGRLLTIYYNTGTKTIAGTFSDLDEWLTVDEDTFEETEVERYFWTGALSGPSAAASTFNFNSSRWNWAEPGTTVTGWGPSFTSKESISGNYSVQFDFKLGGASTDNADTDRDEGLYIFPLYESTNENIEDGMKYRVRLSATHGVSLHYGANSNGDYGDVLFGKQNTANVGEHTLPATLDRDALYTAKIAKIDDGLFLKVWKSGTSEPGWQAEYHDDTIGGEDDEWKFYGYFVNKNYDKDSENAFLTNMQFNQLLEEQWDLSNAFRADNVTQTNEYAKLEFHDDANGVSISNGYMTYFQLADVIGGDYELQMDVTFHKDFDYRQGSPYYQDNGLCLQPQYNGSNGNRLMLTVSHGLEVGVSGGASYGGYFASLYEGNGQPTSFALNTPYTLAISKANGVMKIKAAPASEDIDAVDWQYEITENVEMKEWAFDFRYVDKSADGSKSITVENISYYGSRQKEVTFWDEMFSNKDATEEVFDFTEPNRWNWPEGGMEATSKYYEYPDMVSKSTIEGDYTAQFDFTLTGVSNDTGADRDEGLYVMPLSVPNSAFENSKPRYRIRLSATEGVQLTYSTNSVGDYAGVLGGVRDGKDGNDTFPSTLERSTPYTLKYEKAGDTLSIKVWKAAEEEPTDWQFVYSDSTIDVQEPYHFIFMFVNKGATGSGDTEAVLLSGAKFYQMVDKTLVNAVGMKEDYRWFFWDTDVSDKANVAQNFSMGGTWNYTADGLTGSSKTATMTSKEVISGHYTTKMNFVLGGTGNEGDGLFVYPLNKSSNAYCTKDYKIKLTSENGLQLFYETNEFGYSGGELTESYEDRRPETLETGVEYTMKVTKMYDELAVKVWPADEAEPLGWDIMWHDKSVGFATRYLDGSWGYPYDHSRYGETDNSGNVFRWGFKITAVNNSGNAAATVTDLKFYKDIDLDINHTEFTVNVGDTAQNLELNAIVYPNIYAQLPAPATPVQYSSEKGLVELTPIIHNPGVRVNRALVTGLAEGVDTICMTMPGLVDENGEPVVITSTVTVGAQNSSDEFKTEADGYITEVIYAQNFEEMDVNTNITPLKEYPNFVVNDVSFNPMEDFFEYQPFYAMSYQAVLQDNMIGVNEDGISTLIARNNKYLQTYAGSGNQYSGVRMRSYERIQGDYTFQADVYLGSSAAEFRVDLQAQRQWVKPSGEACYVLESSMTSQEMLEHADYEFGFRQWYTRVRRNASTGINIFDETEMASGWQTVKAVKAGDTLYFKSWPKGGKEPEWEVIKTDDKLLAAEEKFGGGYLSIEVVPQYTDITWHGGKEASVYVDNIMITRQKRATTEDGEDMTVSKVTLVTKGGEIKESCEVTSYIEGIGAKLPTADQMTKKDHTFGGWFASETFDPTTRATEIGADATGDLTFYAKWLADNPDGIPEEPGRENDIAGNGVPSAPAVPEQPEEPDVPDVPEEDTITFTTSMTASFSLENEVIMNVNPQMTGFPEGFDHASIYDRVGVMIWRDGISEDQATIENAVEEDVYYATGFNADSNRYEIVAASIPAKEMGRSMSVRPFYINNEGEYVYGKFVAEYSLKKFSQSKLNSTSAKDEEKAVIVALLNYGTAAQNYFGYRTDEPVNSILSEEQKNYTWDASLVRTDWTVPAAKEGTLTRDTAYVTSRAGTLQLEGAINNQWTFRTKGTVAKAEVLIWTEAEYKAAGVLTEANAGEIRDLERSAADDTTSGAAYVLVYEGLPAKQMFQPVYACAKFTDGDGDVHYSGVMALCPERWASTKMNSTTEKDKELARTMILYGDAARAYFG